MDECMDAGTDKVKSVGVSAIVKVFEIYDKFEESNMSCNKVGFGLFMSMNDTRCIYEFAKMLVKVVREDSIEVRRAKPVDIHQVLHCLITTRYLLCRISRKPGLDTARDVLLGTRDVVPVALPSFLICKYSKFPC